MENQDNQLRTLSGTSLRADLSKYPSLRNLKNDVPLEQALAYVFTLIGLPKPYPSGLEKTVLISFLKESYPSFIAPEIISAFKMAINRQLGNLDYDNLLNHYGNFNAKYMAGILNAYHENYRCKVLVPKTPPRIESDPKHNDLIFYTQHIFIPYDKMCKGEGNTFLSWALRRFYKELNPKGLFKEYVENKSYQQFLDQAKSEVERKREGIRLESEIKWNERVIDRARELLVLDWLSIQAIEGADIRETVMSRIR